MIDKNVSASATEEWLRYAGSFRCWRRAVISVDRAAEEWLRCGSRLVRLYPDRGETLRDLFVRAGCECEPVMRLERAECVAARKPWMNYLQKCHNIWRKNDCAPGKLPV